MALIPHKADPNYEQQMIEYAKDNSRWGGTPEPVPTPPAKPKSKGTKNADNDPLRRNAI